MNTKRRDGSEHTPVDPQHDGSDNPFDQPSGLTGQAYATEREGKMGRRKPSGHPLIGDPTAGEPLAADPQGRDIPPENGCRAWADPTTGEVHGNGSGAGGGEDTTRRRPADPNRRSQGPPCRWRAGPVRRIVRSARADQLAAPERRAAFTENRTVCVSSRTSTCMCP